MRSDQEGFLKLFFTSARISFDFCVFIVILITHTVHVQAIQKIKAIKNGIASDPVVVPNIIPDKINKIKDRILIIIKGFFIFVCLIFYSIRVSYKKRIVNAY